MLLWFQHDNTEEQDYAMLDLLRSVAANHGAAAALAELGAPAALQTMQRDRTPAIMQAAQQAHAAILQVTLHDYGGKEDVLRIRPWQQARHPSCRCPCQACQRQPSRTRRKADVTWIMATVSPKAGGRQVPTKAPGSMLWEVKAAPVRLAAILLGASWSGTDRAALSRAKSGA